MAQIAVDGKINSVEALRRELANGDYAQPQAPERLYVYFSFDLVNSTLYKTLNPKSWPRVTQKFYDLVERGLDKRLEDVSLWKYVGDELLLYRRIESPAALAECVTRSASVLHDTIVRIHQLFPDTKTVLSLKATVWCAKVAEPLPEELSAVEAKNETEYENILIRQFNAEGKEQIDFLGPDIDIGFRISKYAARARLVVSADIAYLLYRNRGANAAIESQLRLVSFEQLKGVWNNRQYPIFWFEQSWNDLKSSFLYDEHNQNEIVRRLSDKPEGQPLSQIARIYQDLDLTDRADGLWELLQRPATDASADAYARASSAALSSLIEVHCVAICFRPDGAVLIAKRTLEKKRFPGKWEFGCGQLGPYETFADCLKRSYKEDFGAVLIVDDNPTPVHTFLINDKRGPIPGIIFIAELQNAEDLTVTKHTGIDWVKSGVSQTIQSAECVPDLFESIESARGARDRLAKRRSD